MMKAKRTMWICVLLFAAFMSVPFLVPHCGFFALFGLVPLLCMERVASLSGTRRVWIWHYSAFVLWNTATTFWVGGATVGGAIFAILANSLQMSLVFGLFRLSKKRFEGTLPYIFLAAAWMAWERWYMTSAQISWPWLVLGNAFARSTGWIQWYEYTGTMGGSLWVWLSNLGIFGMMVSLSDGRFFERWNLKARIASLAGLACTLVLPPILSAFILSGYEEKEEPLEVAILQPNFDPYQKFESLSQNQQDAILEQLFKDALKDRRAELAESSCKPLLVLTPETFTRGIANEEPSANKTWRRMNGLLEDYPGVNMMLGASSRDYIPSAERPSPTARQIWDTLWVESHNSAFMLDGSGRSEVYHKSKLVVGTEMLPYPRVLRPIDDKFFGGICGRDIGQDEMSLLHCIAPDGTSIPVGSIICYESVYGEFCTQYVREGARMLAIITNDAWWGDTPGYRQHLSYACLRAIETRRSIARCGNTGISAFINQKGQIVEQGPWWERCTLRGTVNMNDELSFFVRHGDIVGRVASFLFLLLLLALGVRLFTKEK